MKFGVREICNVVFKAKATTKIGNATFQAKQPVLYIDTAKTSTLEGAATTVYATGGRGNARLIAWEGEKTLTFTVEDAVLSPAGFAILSGAGLLNNSSTTNKVHVHATATAQAINGVIDLSGAIASDEAICADAPIYVLKMEKDDFSGQPREGVYSKGTGNNNEVKHIVTVQNTETKIADTTFSGVVFVDFYIQRTESTVHELQIDAENFAGYYYVEADCLFRRKSDGVDLPAELTFPKVKIQSNFTFNMAATGDPSTFTFTMDAMPDYTYFNPQRKVLCAIQIVDDPIAAEASEWTSAFPCTDESHSAIDDE